MSDKLAISAAISTLLMAAYALLGAESARLPLGQDGVDALAPAFEVSAPNLPSAGDVLPDLH